MKKKLLIADDESAIRALVRMTLEDISFEIFEAGDGNEALVIARAKHPDMIILDVSMPGISGFEVCRRLKQDPTTRDITIMMLTARAQDVDKIEGSVSGADEYFTKPFSPIALVRKVEGILGGAPSL
jgi:DNA-binding response OmpR family regulator